MNGKDTDPAGTGDWCYPLQLCSCLFTETFLQALGVKGTSPVVQRVKNLPATGFHPWVGKIPWRRRGQPTPVFLPEKSHGQITAWLARVQRVAESDVTEQLGKHKHREVKTHETGQVKSQGSYRSPWLGSVEFCLESSHLEGGCGQVFSDGSQRKACSVFGRSSWDLSLAAVAKLRVTETEAEQGESYRLSLVSRLLWAASRPRWPPVSVGERGSLCFADTTLRSSSACCSGPGARLPSAQPVGSPWAWTQAHPLSGRP